VIPLLAYAQREFITKSDNRESTALDVSQRRLSMAANRPDMALLENHPLAASLNVLPVGDCRIVSVTSESKAPFLRNMDWSKIGWNHASWQLSSHADREFFVVYGLR
jgi:hypothetical protein